MLGKTYASTTSSTSELRIPGEVGEDRREEERGDSQVGSAVNLVPRCALSQVCTVSTYYVQTVGLLPVQEPGNEARMQCVLYIIT